MTDGQSEACRDQIETSGGVCPECKDNGVVWTSSLVGVLCRRCFPRPLSTPPGFLTVYEKLRPIMHEIARHEVAFTSGTLAGHLDTWQASAREIAREEATERVAGLHAVVRDICRELVDERTMDIARSHATEVARKEAAKLWEHLAFESRIVPLPEKSHGIHFKQGGDLHGCPLCNQVGIPARDGSGNYRCASGHLWNPETQAKISQAEASEKPPAGGEAVDNGDVLERLRTMAVAGRDFVTVGDAITELAALRQQLADAESNAQQDVLRFTALYKVIRQHVEGDRAETDCTTIYTPVSDLNADLAATQRLQAEVAELREKLARMTEAADGWRDEKAYTNKWTTDVLKLLRSLVEQEGER